MTAVHAAAASGFDLIDLRRVLSSAREAIRALWAPSKSEINAAKMDFGGFVSALANPLLRVPPEEFGSVVEAFSANASKIHARLQEIISKPSFRAWAEQATQAAAVDSLRPTWKNREAALLHFDIEQRATLLEAAIATGRPDVRGVRAPSKEEWIQKYLQYVAGYSALVIASYEPIGAFRKENIDLSYNLSTGALKFRAKHRGIRAERITTDRDNQMQVALLDHMDAEQDRHRARVESTFRDDVEQFVAFDE